MKISEVGMIVTHAFDYRNGVRMLDSKVVSIRTMDKHEVIVLTRLESVEKKNIYNSFLKLCIGLHVF